MYDLFMGGFCVAYFVVCFHLVVKFFAALEEELDK